MNVFFDVDYTLLSFDGTMRRGAQDVFSRLAADGHHVYVWSGVGMRWSVVRSNGLEPYVTNVFVKPLQDFDQGLVTYGVSVVPDFVIDDYPQIVGHFGGYYIKEFYDARDDDDELESVYQVVTEVALTGTSSHPRWKPPTRLQAPLT